MPQKVKEKSRKIYQESNLGNLENLKCFLKGKHISIPVLKALIKRVEFLLIYKIFQEICLAANPIKHLVLIYSQNTILDMKYIGTFIFLSISPGYSKCKSNRICIDNFLITLGLKLLTLDKHISTILNFLKFKLNLIYYSF